MSSILASKPKENREKVTPTGDDQVKESEQIVESKECTCKCKHEIKSKSDINNLFEVLNNVVGKQTKGKN